MADHYSDYLKKSIPASELVFDDIKESDKKLLSRVKKQRIKDAMAFLILMTIAFTGCLFLFGVVLFGPSDVLIFKIIALVVIGAGAFITGKQIFDLIAGYKGIIKGVVIASQRIQEQKDNRNYTYQYVFDIYLEEKDQTLMSYAVMKDVFERVNPGDGVILVKLGGKVKVFEERLFAEKPCSTNRPECTPTSLRCEM